MINSEDRLLTHFGIEAVYHYAPLHYLAFIARSGVLLSKTQLGSIGFSEDHFRRTSQKQDRLRGFADFVHLTLDVRPPILEAKLARGFPHFECRLPAADVEQSDYSLCRFNIAKTRYFRGAKQEPEESDRNGRYYNGMLLPTARTNQEKGSLLKHNVGHTMVEVLVRDRLTLGANTVLRFFHEQDLEIAVGVMEQVGGTKYALEVDDALKYKRSNVHLEAVVRALEESVGDASWRGTGLDFDGI